MGTAAAPNPTSLTVNGKVHGGQQAVVGALIQLYVVGSGGNGSAASPLLNTAVTSDSNGEFSITGDYTCPSATSQVYLVATQGNPGSGTNAALAMMTALGSCGNLSPSQFIWINEITTVAAAWALAPFEQDIAHIGSSSTNSTGLANAFLDAQLIADTSTGDVPTLASNLTTETGKIYALADAVAACINSNGAGSPGCSALFGAATPSGGSAPANTWDAVMNVVKNPGNNVAGVYGAIGSTPPFATTLTSAPSDWTLSLTVTGGGLNTPEGLAADSQGNIWVSDDSGIVSAFSPQGTPMSSTGFGSANTTEAYGLAIDHNDNVWVTIAEYPQYANSKGSLEEFSGVLSGSALGTATYIYSDTFDYPSAIAIDNTDGNILVGNYFVNTSVQPNTTNLVIFNPSANTFTSVDTGNDVGVSVGVAADTAQGAWITSDNGTGSGAHVNSSGTVVFSTECCGSTDSVALDSAGNVWLADSEDSDASGDSGGAITELASNGTTEQAFITGGGINVPGHIAIDANQNLWVTNFHAPPGSGLNVESFTELSGVNSGSPGTPISPSTGYGLDADLLVPFSLAIDASGNIWISNTGGNSLVMFFGMAAPTLTPMTNTPQAP
jgi:sugar lactone lactonase YvrE